MYQKHNFFKRSLSIIALLAIVAVACKKNKTDNTVPAAQRIAESKDVILPTQITDQIPSTDTLAFALYAQGVQIYTAVKNAGVAAWASPSTPAADLFDETNTKIGTHYGGPTWKFSATDSIKGVLPPLASRPVNTKSIPWLALATTNATGRFSTINRIVRMNTVGGIAPAKPSLEDADRGRKESVPYTAIYFFYKSK